VRCGSATAPTLPGLGRPVAPAGQVRLLAAGSVPTTQPGRAGVGCRAAERLGPGCCGRAAPALGEELTQERECPLAVLLRFASGPAGPAGCVASKRPGLPQQTARRGRCAAQPGKGGLVQAPAGAAGPGRQLVPWPGRQLVPWRGRHGPARLPLGRRHRRQRQSWPVRPPWTPQRSSASVRPDALPVTSGHSPSALSGRRAAVVACRQRRPGPGSTRNGSAVPTGSAVVDPAGSGGQQQSAAPQSLRPLPR